MNIKQPIRGLCLITLIGGLLLSPSYADEIIFKDQKGVQIGTVLEEDEHTVTVRFPRKSIQSIVRGQKAVSSVEGTRDLESASPAGSHLEEKLKRLQERVERLEKNFEEDKKAGVSPTPAPSKKLATTVEQLLQEELGGVKGVILWRGAPLANRNVMIVLERYTGFSLASLKKVFLEGRGKSSDKEIAFETKTDSQGRYIFEKVPPGQYRMYWMPDTDTGWVHRMREKPDFEIISGKVIIQNIPGREKE